MFKLKKLLVEAITPLLYHITTTSRAVNILDENKFRLTPAYATDADLDLQKGKLYFLSTSRVKYGGYSRSLSDTGYVNFELDGRRLSDNYKSVNVDYWGDFRDVAWEKGNMQQFLRYDENEERIITNDPEIKPAAKYIKSIHVSVGNPEEVKNKDKQKFKKLDTLSNQLGINAYFYTQPKYWKKQITQKAESSVEDIFGDVEGDYQSSERRMHIRYIPAVINVLEADHPNELDELGENLYDKLKYSSPEGEVKRQFKAEIHNNKSNPKVLDKIRRISKAMKKHGKSTINGVLEIVKDKVNKFAKTELKPERDKYKDFVDSVKKVYRNREKTGLSLEDVGGIRTLKSILEYFSFDQGEFEKWDMKTQNSAYGVVDDIRRLMKVGYFQELQNILSKENRSSRFMSFMRKDIQPALRYLASNENLDWNN